MNSLLKIALDYYGLFEYKGRSTHPVLKKMFARVGRILSIDLENYDDSKLSWCGIFMANIFYLSGNERFIPKRAITARKWAGLDKFPEWRVVTLDEAQAGDVVVFWRNCETCWQGHVALFVNKFNSNKIRVLGGNQSDGVTIRRYSSSRIIKIIRYEEV